MEAKKSDKANLEKTKTMFTLLGLVISISIVILAFEWKSYDEKEEATQLTQVVQEVEEMVIQTRQEETPPPPEEPQQAETTEFEIVDDDQELKNEFSIETFENTGNAEVFIPKVEVVEEVVEEEEQTIFIVVEESASYPGGIQEMTNFIKNNLKYPQQARETGTQGKVFVTFVVEKDGSLTDVKVLRDIGSGCGEEAVRVVKSMPKWKPAKQRGKPVRMQFNLPVAFTLAG